MGIAFFSRQVNERSLCILAALWFFKFSYGPPDEESEGAYEEHYDCEGVGSYVQEMGHAFWQPLWMGKLYYYAVQPSEKTEEEKHLTDNFDE